MVTVSDEVYFQRCTLKLTKMHLSKILAVDICLIVGSGFVGKNVELCPGADLSDRYKIKESHKVFVDRLNLSAYPSNQGRGHSSHL